MAFLFPSEEWLNELKDRMNANPDYEKAGATWEGTTTLHVLPEEGKLEEEYILWTDPWHGKVRAAKRLKSLDEEHSEYLLSAKYSTWKEVIKGDLDAMKGIMKGKIKVKGKMADLLKQTKASNILMKTFQNIDTRFIDE